MLLPSIIPLHEGEGEEGTEISKCVARHEFLSIAVIFGEIWIE
jgi:hypothetical protein